MRRQPLSLEPLEPRCLLNGSPLPALSIADLWLSEGDAGATEFNFLVQLSAPSLETVEVSYATQDDTATAADGDYEPASGQLTFAPGEVAKTLSILVWGDSKYEPDETFLVVLSDPVGATLEKATGVGTIENDDPLPAVSIADMSQAEGDEESSLFQFTVYLSAPSFETVYVYYATSDGTATTADGDYWPASGMLTFAPGETEKTVGIVVYGDRVFEPDETFLVVLTYAEGAELEKAIGVGMIENDDDRPTISINDLALEEGDAGFRYGTFTVRLSAPSVETVEVSYTTEDGTATAADVDYWPASGRLTFAPGEALKTISILVWGDTKYEPDETFFVVLSDPVGGTLEKATGVGTIENDDPYPTISIADYTQPEGHAGQTTFSFLVSLSNPTSEPVRVLYETLDGTATMAGGDYLLAEGELTIAPGETSATITVLVNGDRTLEPNETFFVELSDPLGATPGVMRATGTILNDDMLASVSGFVFVDSNGNGRPDVREGVAGVKIALATTGGAVLAETWTDQDGYYVFAQLAGGSYEIIEHQPVALVDGGANVLVVNLLEGENRGGLNYRELGLRPESVYNRLLSTTSLPIGSEQWQQAVDRMISDANQAAGYPAAPSLLEPQVVQANRQVRIRGTQGDDSFVLVLGQTEHVALLNAQVFRFEAAAVDAIFFDGLWGNDTAWLSSSGGSHWAQLRPKGGLLQAPACAVELSAVEQIAVEGGGGDNWAELIDSLADDELHATLGSARLEAYFFANELTGFGRVKAKSLSGGTDRLWRLEPLDFLLETEGPWIQM